MAIRSYQDVKPTVAEQVYVDESAQVIGRVDLGARSSVWPMAVLRGDVNSISVGADTNIQDGTIVHVTHDGPYSPGGIATVIGEQVTIGHQAMIHACTIGDRCLIGMGAILLDGVVVETEVMVAAGSLVAPHTILPSGFLYMGRPAKAVRPLTEQERTQLQYSAQHYVRLAEHYLAT